jgi:hypothetical protein
VLKFINNLLGLKIPGFDLPNRLSGLTTLLLSRDQIKSNCQ